MSNKLILFISLFTSIVVASPNDRTEYMLNELNTDRLTSNYFDGCEEDSPFLNTNELTGNNTSYNCTRVVDVPYKECEALAAFYYSTHGGSWCNNDGWLDTNRACHWHGVECSGGHVSGLSLRREGLAGEIPTELSNLTHLEILDLVTNLLIGEIPSELGNLSDLRELYLYENKLSGEIPNELGNLTKLEKLSLSVNQLTGEIPSELSNLSNLDGLGLSNNQLTGSIPSELGNLTNLKGLYLFNNQLTGSIPNEFGNLTNLEWLFLYNNQLTGSIPSEFGNLTNLEWLSLYNNQLTGSIPSEFGNLTNLGRLYLDENQLTGSIPSELSNLTNLEALDLNYNRLTGSIPSELSNLTRLESLNLNYNQLAGSIPTEFGNFTDSLSLLDLSQNLLTGSIPSELGNLSNLEELYLNSNELTGSIPSELSNMSKLEKLLLNSNELCGEIPADFKNLPRIKLKLDDNHLTASDPELIEWLYRHNKVWDATQTPCPYEYKLQFFLASYYITENGGQAIITVTRTGDSDGAVSVEYATSDDAATNHDDYTQSSGTLSWSDGDDADKSFTVNIIDDSEPENDEIFIVSLANPTGGIELGDPDTAIVTIMDNDSAFSCEKVTTIPKKECQTLIALYNSTDGENWTDNTGWKATDNPCDWYGVSCQDGRVRGLALGNNNLKGSISKKLYKLKKLTELDLNDNCLDTKVSKKLGKWLDELNPGWDETQTDCLNQIF
ncbi:MAG: leucine-rich repeat domain-containing protein [Pseudomonadota bacterium]